MKITAWNSAKLLRITGHGLKVTVARSIAPGVTVTPVVAKLDKGLDDNKSLIERASITAMHEIADFCLEVEDVGDGKRLVDRGWDCLWDFHLLSLSARSPCIMLYNVCPGPRSLYSVANRNYMINPFEDKAEIDEGELDWATHNRSRFRSLISDKSFSSAMRYFGNSHYLFDLEHRIMLLWAGIEGILNVEAEHNRRIALYSAILLNGTPEAKWATFEDVKKAYSLRSRVVHGAKPSHDKLKEGYKFASQLLSGLLGRCVELGRVPTRAEFDKAALSASL